MKEAPKAKEQPKAKEEPKPKVSEAKAKKGKDSKSKDSKSTTLIGKKRQAAKPVQKSAPVKAMGAKVPATKKPKRK